MGRGRSGRARISTRFPARAGSTGRSASSPGSRRSSGSGLRASASSSSATRSEAAPAAAASRHARTPTSSCTSSRGRGSSARMRRSASSPRSSATCAGGGRSKALLVMRARRRWTRARTPSLRPPNSCCTHARSRSGIEGAVATVGQVTVEPGGTNVIPGRVTVSVDARAPDAERLDRLADVPGDRGADPDRAVADVGGDPGGAPGRDRGARPARARAALRRRPRRGHPRERRDRRPGCCSSAASTAASVTIRTS